MPVTTDPAPSAAAATTARPGPVPPDPVRPDPTLLDADGRPWRPPLRTPTAPAWTPPLRPTGPDAWAGSVRDAGRTVSETARRTPTGPTVRAAVVAAVLALPLVPVLTSVGDPAGPAVEPAAVVSGSPAPEAARTAPVATAGARAARPVAPPSGLSVPAIGLTAGAPEPLGIDASGALGAPVDFDRIGFWTGGPTPGEAGPAVIVGHVDSFRGPAVFWRLRDIPVGARIVVPRTDGRSTTFTVDAVRVFPKDAFPSDEVYGPTANAQLRLITCGGAFDRASRSYEENVVVFASAR